MSGGRFVSWLLAEVRARRRERAELDEIQARIGENEDAERAAGVTTETGEFTEREHTHARPVDPVAWVVVLGLPGGVRRCRAGPGVRGHHPDRGRPVSGCGVMTERWGFQPAAWTENGLPTFAWRCAPAGLLTRRQMRAAGLAPGGAWPVAQIVCRRGRVRALLFDPAELRPKRVPTAARLAAVGKALAARRWCRGCERDVGYTVPTSLGRCIDCHYPTDPWHRDPADPWHRDRPGVTADPRRHHPRRPRPARAGRLRLEGPMDETTTGLTGLTPGGSGRDDTAAAARLSGLRAAGIPGALADLFDNPRARLRHGVPVWWTHHHGDCDFDELFAHSHDRRRVLAAVSGMIRDNRVHYHELRVAETGWCRLITECGCTAERHAAEHDGGGDCEPACRFPDLPPCGGLDAPYAWQLDRVPAVTPGAVPFTWVVLS